MSVALHNDNLGTVRFPRQKNLKNNIKIRQKDFYLRNLKTKDVITVRPPKSGKPGFDADGVAPKDRNGQWIRCFHIVKAQGVKTFARKKEIILVHLPGVKPHHRDPKGRVWELEPIPGVKSTNQKRKRRRAA